MEFPGGRTVVGLVAAGVVIGGLVMAVRGLKQDFEDKLDARAQAVAAAGACRRDGRPGVARAGVRRGRRFRHGAALTYDPHKAKGLDEAVKTIEQLPLGHVCCSGCGAVGLLCFGLWSFAEARWRKI